MKFYFFVQLWIQRFTTQNKVTFTAIREYLFYPNDSSFSWEGWAVQPIQVISIFIKQRQWPLKVQYNDKWLRNFTMKISKS